jgi:hypothetical protein
MMDNQKFPGIVELHCNGRTYSNAYLITLAHVHMFSFDPATVGSAGGRLLLGSSRVRTSHLIWCLPWFRNMFPTGKRAKVAQCEIQRVLWWHNKRCVARCRNHRPYHLPSRFLRTASRNLCRTCKYKWPVTLSRRYGLKVHRTVDVQDFGELFDCPTCVYECMYSYIYICERN